MHLRWILFAFSVGAFLLGLLTVVRSPAWSPWKLAVLAGEYGHWLAGAVMLIAFAAWNVRVAGSILTPTTLMAASVSAVLLLKPAFQAARIAAALPAELRAQFGDYTTQSRAFAVVRLFAGRNPEPVTVRTLQVAPGLPLDFYAAGGTDGRAVPCVVVVHGGGWDNGDRTQMPEFNHWIARQGYAVAAVSYRLAPRFIWPAQRDDVLAAIAFLKAHAVELGIDSARLVLLGRSAGGQIAQAVAYTAGDPSIRGVAGLYAPADLNFGYAHADENDMLGSPRLMRQYLGGTPETARANFDSASAHLHAEKHAPPTLLVHGENDALVWYRHSVRLDARLADLGVPRVFVSLPWASHAFEFNLHGPGGQLTTFALEWFLAGVTE